jgi:hypothetical protein
MRSGLAVFVCALAAVAGCSNESTDNKVQAYRKQQATDLVAGYDQARSQGDLLTMCVKSNQVSAAYRDAKDAPDADAWKAKASEDCRAARKKFAPDLQDASRDERAN